MLAELVHFAATRSYPALRAPAICTSILLSCRMCGTLLLPKHRTSAKRPKILIERPTARRHRGTVRLAAKDFDLQSPCEESSRLKPSPRRRRHLHNEHNLLGPLSPPGSGYLSDIAVRQAAERQDSYPIAPGGPGTTPAGPARTRTEAVQIRGPGRADRGQRVLRARTASCPKRRNLYVLAELQMHQCSNIVLLLGENDERTYLGCDYLEKPTSMEPRR